MPAIINNTPPTLTFLIVPINSADNLERILTSIMDENRVYITYMQYEYEET